MGLMSQRSKKDPKSSFYIYTIPEGLPEDEGAAPNRRLHDDSVATMRRCKRDIFVFLMASNLFCWDGLMANISSWTILDLWLVKCAYDESLMFCRSMDPTE